MAIMNISRHLISLYFSEVGVGWGAFNDRLPDLGGKKCLCMTSGHVGQVLLDHPLGMPWLGKGEDHVEKVLFWPPCPSLPCPSPHALWLQCHVTLVERSVPACGQDSPPCQTSTPNPVASDTKLFSGLGWISGLHANMATSHYQIHRDCKANPDSVGNMRADPILRKTFHPIIIHKSLSKAPGLTFEARYRNLFQESRSKQNGC